MPKDTKEANKNDNSNETSVFDDINLDELINTTNLNISDKYDMIDADDLKTIRKVKIVELPVRKNVKKFNKDLLFMKISDNDKVFSIGADSISLRRSLLACAIKLCNAETKEQIDLSVLIGKLVNIQRTEFKDSYGKHTPYNFSIIE